MKMAMEGKQAPGLSYGLDRILHGEQYTEVIRPLPPAPNPFPLSDNVSYVPDPPVRRY